MRGYGRFAAICLVCLLFVGVCAARLAQAGDRKAADKSGKTDSGAKKDPKKKDAAPAPKSVDEMTPEDVEASLKYEGGKIVLGQGLATLNIPAGFRYLNPEQSRLVLVKLWGNPPGGTTLGMLFPTSIGPLDDDSWGVVITYQEDGYVKDDDADAIDYAELMKQMQEDLAEENQDRQKKGFEQIALVGWAAAPHYDRASHKLYWAKELKFGDSDTNTLNYNVRVLGRKGVLVLNAVSSMDQLSGIETSMQEVLGFVDFNEGNRYADFTPGIDKIAAYGIGALIAGKVLAKVGIFKLLLGFILAAKKFAIVGLVALGALIRKLFGRKPREDQGSTLNLGG